MKIKLNNQIVSKLNEDNAQNSQDQGTQTNSAFNAFEADAEYQYIMQRKREALPVSVILPQKFDLPVKLPTPPEDISNIMSSYQNNKARKTKNIGGVMQDPISTFNHADACCRDAFGNFFGQAIKIQDDEKQRKVDTSYIQKSSNESYNYNEFPVLNESATAATVGSMIGTGIGSVLGEVLTAGICAAAGLASTVGVQVAALGGAAYMLGYWGEELFGNVEGGGISNDKVAAHLNAKSQNMIKPTPSEPQKYTDIVEAIGVYVKDILEAVGDIAGVINPDGAAKIDETSKFVSGFLNTISKKANEFIETHSKEIEEQKKLAQEKRENDLTKQANRSDKVKNFIQKSQNAWAEQAKGPSGMKDFVLLQKIQNAFESAVNSNNNKSIDLSNALDKGGWKGLKDKYNELYPAKSVNASVTINANCERLNEEDGDNEEQPKLTDIKNEEHTTKAKTIIDAEKVYKTLLQEFEAKFREAFPKNIDGKKLPKYEETKEQMKALIEAADKSINSKIEQITKVQQGETGATGGLGQAAKTFLMGHPLESNNLREVWSRHLGDLNMRMTNRLQQMTDTNNKTRTLGWTIQVCRTVVPEILARMLTYRYIYAMLSNEGFFSYDTKTMEADKQAFQNDKDVYVNLPKSKLIWILNNQCLDYTANGQQLLIADPNNGGWTLASSDNMAYAFFLVSKLYGSKGNISTCAKLGEFLSNINAFVKDGDKVAQFLGVVMNAMPDSTKNLLTDPDSAKFEQLANIFKMSDEIKGVKEDILSTYQTLKSQKVPSERDKLVNIAKTLDLVSKNPRNIYTAYIKNRGVIDELIKKVQAEPKMTDELRKDIKNKIVDFFGESVDESVIKDKNYNDVTAESIQKLLPDNQANDYYSSILYMYPLQGLCIWDDEGKFMSHLSADGVKQVCKVVKDLLPLEFSGILAYGLDEANKDKELNDNVKSQIQKVKTFCSDIDLGDKEILNNTDNEEKPEYAELSNQYKELRNKIKNQLINKYQEVSKDSAYRIKGISNESNSLFEAELKQDNTNNNEDWFTQLISKGVLFDNPENIKTALNDVKVLSSDGKSENGKETFGDLDDKDKNTILMNLIQTIDEVNKDSSISKLIDEILKKWGIDAEKEKEKREQPLHDSNKIRTIQSICNTLNTTQGYIETLNEKINELNHSNAQTDNEIEAALNNMNSIKDLIKQFNECYDKVKNQIYSQYNGITGKNLSSNLFAIKSKDFSKFADQIKLFKLDKTNNDPLRGIMGALSDITFEDGGKKFGELEPNEKSKILNNLASSILSVKGNESWEKLEIAIKNINIEKNNYNKEVTSNESIMWFGDKKINATNSNLYFLNEDTTNSLNDEKIEQNVDNVIKDKNKINDILSIFKNSKNDINKSDDIINNDNIIKNLDNILNVITSFSI